MAGTTERVDLIDFASQDIRLRRGSSSLLRVLRSIVPFLILSKTPEDAYHSALLLSNFSRVDKKAAIHVFYDLRLWNIDPLPNLKDDLIARAG